MLVCQYCNKECKNTNSQRNHEQLCKSNPTRIPTWLELNRGKGYEFVNQHTKAGSDWEYTEEQKAKMKAKAIGRKHSDETKQKLSEIAKLHEVGGRTSSKRYVFVRKNGDEVHLQSSYELQFAELLEKLNVDWHRPAALRWTDEQGIQHRYYPDFMIGKVYVDTKNDYLAEVDAKKIEAVRQQNNVDIRIVLKQDINEAFILSLMPN